MTPNAVKGRKGFVTIPIENRFWNRTSMADNGCRNWTGRKHPSGYGEVGFDGGKERTHRVAWILTYGTIPQGKCVLHSCDNPSCVNPHHLFLGSRRENTDDMVRKNRQAFGSRNGMHKLSESDIPRILDALSSGTKQSDIARSFGVSQATISLIDTAKNWNRIIRTLQEAADDLRSLGV